MDPGIAGLLEGAAFMAARVQLKIKSEFSEFTTALLDQVLPDYLAPVPSATLLQVTPKYNDGNLKDGLRFAAGAYVDAVYLEQQRRISCRYRLSGDLEIWPLHLEAAQYYPATAPLQALGLEIAPGVAAGLRLSFRHRKARLEDDKPGVERLARRCRIWPSTPADPSPRHAGRHGRALRAAFRQSEARHPALSRRLRRPAVPRPAPDFVSQIGFDEDDSLLASGDRSFKGFSLLRDFFVFPSAFIGFRLQHLRKALSSIKAPAFDLLFEFDAAAPRLASVVKPDIFGLYCIPAVNLFETQCSRVPVRRSESEHHVVVDRSRWLDFEAHHIVEVFAHYGGSTRKVPVFPLYSLPTDGTPLAEALFYTRRLPRRETVQEQRTGPRSSYSGTEIFLSLREPASIDEEERVRELSVRALVSNRI